MAGKKKLKNFSIPFIAGSALFFWVVSISFLVEKPEKPRKAKIAKPLPAKIAATKFKLKIAKAEAVEKIAKASGAANKVVSLGLNKLGTRYVFGGTSESGFDCSGFVFFVFDKAGVKVPRSSELLAQSGKPIPMSKARRGDILIFTGTNSKIRKPGHVGIVISKKDGTLSFVHASSYGGVKISQVNGTNYERRFLEVRRVL